MTENIHLSTYIDPKKSSFYKVVEKKYLKIFLPLLIKSKKDVILQHLDEKKIKII